MFDLRERKVLFAVPPDEARELIIAGMNHAKEPGLVVAQLS
jgi:hypothetical protein